VIDLLRTMSNPEDLLPHSGEPAASGLIETAEV
jgi:hypothetical protein